MTCFCIPPFQSSEIHVWQRPGTPDFIKLHQVTSGYVWLHTGYIRLHQVTSGYIKLHQVTYRLHQVTSGYIKLHQVTSGYIRLHHVTTTDAYNIQKICNLYVYIVHKLSYLRLNICIMGWNGVTLITSKTCRPVYVSTSYIILLWFSFVIYVCVTS